MSLHAGIDCTDVAFPNPDPRKFVIADHEEIGKFLILFVQYPDCTNFEGYKVLVYSGVTYDEIKSRRVLDPHFTDSQSVPSPVARFTPTEAGLEMARTFCKCMEERE